MNPKKEGRLTVLCNRLRNNEEETRDWDEEHFSAAVGEVCFQEGLLKKMLEGIEI